MNVLHHAATFSDKIFRLCRRSTNTERVLPLAETADTTTGLEEHRHTVRTKSDSLRLGDRKRDVLPKMLRVGAFAAALLAAPSASAVTVTEATLGDFTGNLNNPANLGTLDFGANTIEGSLNTTCVFVSSGSCFGLSGDDADAFSFLIPDGGELTAADVTISILSSSGSGSRTILGRSFTALDSFSTRSSSTSDILFRQRPLTGRQNFQLFTSFGFGTERSDQLSANWTAEFTVSRQVAPVPLPAGLSLLLAGLGTLAVLKRRRTVRAKAHLVG